MTNYCCGFLFSKQAENQQIVLIKKNRPAWQAGYLNGVGGKIEFGETPLQSMIREFKEETGVTIKDWQSISSITGINFTVHFFTSFADSSIVNSVKSLTDEEVSVYPVSIIDQLPLVENVQSLVLSILTKETELNKT